MKDFVMKAEHRAGKFHNANWNVIHQATIYMENTFYVSLSYGLVCDMTCDVI
jgi:hypothetical protein